MKLPLALCLLLAAPAQAQDPGEEMQARLDACLGGIDLDAIATRSEAFASARGYEARVAAFCAAGDEAGATAYARELQDEFYAQDADTTRMRDCFVEVFGEQAVAVEAVCDE